MGSEKKYLNLSAVKNAPGNNNIFFQPKLSINQPNDIYEQEADTMADRVMRMEGPSQEKKFFAPSIIQRKCAECEEEEKKLRRKESNTETTAVSSQTENYLNTLSGGKTLSNEEKSFFEPRMGYDFSNVKLHTDNAAIESAKNINALAYTKGNNIVFGEGKYQPNTDEGKKLMAHELTHVVQQASGINPKKIQRKVVVNPAAQTSYVAGLLGTICNAPVGVSGNTVTSNCNASTNNSCDCVCDVTSDPARTYTINVQPQVSSPQNKTLWNRTNVVVPMITPWPNTAPGTNPTITIHSPTGRNTELGAFDSSGNVFYLPDWRILGHELCGHGRLGQTYSGSAGTRPAHDSTIDTENTIAAEQGSGLVRGHYADRRQGESFFNPIGNRSRIAFFQSNGLHYEAP